MYNLYTLLGVKFPHETVASRRRQRRRSRLQGPFLGRLIDGALAYGCECDLGTPLIGNSCDVKLWMPRFTYRPLAQPVSVKTSDPNPFVRTLSGSSGRWLALTYITRDHCRA